MTNFPRIFRVLKNRWLRPVLLGLIAVLIIAEIVALSPTSLEEGPPVTASGEIDPAALVPDNDRTLAEGIPKDRIPEYTAEKFNHVSTDGTTRLWNLAAERAFFYNKEGIVHSRNVDALLFEAEGKKATRVTGREAKYVTGKKDLEIFGDVHTVLPDGFEIKSEYLRYLPPTRTIQIPTKYLVAGDGAEGKDARLEFHSQGLNFAMGQSVIELPQSVKVVYAQQSAVDNETTTIVSDHCIIDRNKQLAFFTMTENRPDAERFVHITQPKLFAKGRKADLNYGDSSSVLHYLRVREDAFIEEIGKKSLFHYATGGLAEFDAKRDLIVLSEYPQVYEEDDTVTGDVIILHRDTDIIEVEHSNAFSQGTQNNTDSP